jgi:hypothetical protein
MGYSDSCEGDCQSRVEGVPSFTEARLNEGAVEAELGSWHERFPGGFWQGVLRLDRNRSATSRSRNRIGRTCTPIFRRQAQGRRICVSTAPKSSRGERTETDARNDFDFILDAFRSNLPATPTNHS